MIDELNMGMAGGRVVVGLNRPPSALSKLDVRDLRGYLNALHNVLQRQPHKRGHEVSVGGILNAYREGDLRFDEAVDKLESLHSTVSQNWVLDKLKEIQRAVGHGVQVRLSTEIDSGIWRLEVYGPDRDSQGGWVGAPLVYREGGLESAIQSTEAEVPRLRERLEGQANDRQERDKIRRVVESVLAGMGVGYGGDQGIKEDGET